MPSACSWGRAVLGSVGLFAAVSTSACGSSHANTSLSLIPQIDDNGGGILTAPEIVSVTFDPSLYTNATSPTAVTVIADLLDFDDTITQSAWWDTVRAGYCEPLESTNCVGRGTPVNAAIDHVAVTANPPTSFTDGSQGRASTFQPYVSGLFAANTLPAPNASSLYVFYLPKSVALAFNGATMCTDIGGYHNSLTVGTRDVPYVVVGLCDPEATAQATVKLTVEQTATFAASHEILEATTDPFAGKKVTSGNATQYLGFYLTNVAYQAWPLVLGGGEVADLCVDPFGLGQDRWVDGKYTVQRAWNNLSAAATHDPCVPIPSGEVYFNVAPPTSDDAFQTSVGSTLTFTAVAFADGVMDPWNVELVDLGQAADGTQSTVLTTSPSTKTSTSAGAKLACSIRLNSAPPTQPNEVAGDPGYEPYAFVSINAAGQHHLWPGIVSGR